METPTNVYSIYTVYICKSNQFLLFLPSAFIDAFRDYVKNLVITSSKRGYESLMHLQSSSSYCHAVCSLTPQNSMKSNLSSAWINCPPPHYVIISGDSSFQAQFTNTLVRQRMTQEMGTCRSLICGALKDRPSTLLSFAQAVWMIA